jgi:hypothetical protein
MRANKANVNGAVFIVNSAYETVVVSFDIEDNPIIGQETSIAVSRLYVRWRFPISPLCVGIPGTQRLFGILMPFPELSQRSPGDNPHSAIIRDFESSKKESDTVTLALSLKRLSILRESSGCPTPNSQSLSNLWPFAFGYCRLACTH